MSPDTSAAAEAAARTSADTLLLMDDSSLVTVTVTSLASAFAENVTPGISELNVLVGLVTE